MADAVYKKEFSGILKRIKKEKDGFIYDNAYYIIPKLKSAIKSLSRGFNADLCEKLEEKLSKFVFSDKAQKSISDAITQL